MGLNNGHLDFAAQPQAVHADIVVDRVKKLLCYLLTIVDDHMEDGLW